MRDFIKNYWLHSLLVIFGAVYSCIKVANGEWADAIFALAFAVVSAGYLMTKIEYDFLHEDHAQLVCDYIKELNPNLNFIERSKEKLADIISDVDKIKQENGPALSEGKPKKRPAKKNTTKKS